MNVSGGILVLALIGAVTAQRSLAGQPDWDRPAAARYLGDRIDLWFGRATQLQTGEGKVACVSCHTVVPYLAGTLSLWSKVRSPRSAGGVKFRGISRAPPCAAW